MSPNDPSYDKSYSFRPLLQPRNREERTSETRDRGKSWIEGESNRFLLRCKSRLVFSNAWVGSPDREEAERLKRRERVVGWKGETVEWGGNRMNGKRGCFRQAGLKGMLGVV